MYQIMENGKPIAYAEEIIYIKMQDNGSYGQATFDEATGIAANGTPYHLEGRPTTGVEGLPTVTFEIIDAAQMFAKQEQMRADIDYLSVMLGVELL